MTDVLTNPFSPPAEDEMFSPNETRPKITIEQAPATASCPECGASFTGPLRNPALGRHRKAKHGVAGTSKARSAKKTPASPRKPTAGSTRTATTGASSRRRPLGEGLGDVIEKLAGVFANVNPPAGNALAFAAPALGASVDGVVAGTFVDKKVLQPLSNGSEKWGKLAGAAGLPFMALAVSMQPQLFSVLEGEMRKAMVVCLRERVKILKKRRDEERKVTDALAELAELDPELAASPDPIGAMLQGFFVGFQTSEDDGPSQ